MIPKKVFSVLLLFVQLCGFGESVPTVENCTLLMNTNPYRTLRTVVPPSPRPDYNGKYCGRSERTCCTDEAEEGLKDLAKSDYDKAVKKALTNLSRMLKSKSAKFNEYFKDLLDKSKKDFHEMFKRTYGMVYEQNSYVFSNFFSELDAYYTSGKSNLADVMDSFFNILYQKMFVVLNSQFKFDDKYLGCVSEHMNELKPFGDVPQKLSLPLKRSFVAARMYSQSLSLVGDVVTNLISLMPNENCYNAVTKMLHCSVCKNVPNAKVCQGFCVNVMKGCLAFHSEVDVEWNNFVDVFHKVQQRLLGPFNLELVVEPINVKISEAIMNFQENSAAVAAKVFNGCGKPPLLDSRRRRRRQANSNRKLDARNNRRINNNNNKNNNNNNNNNNNDNNSDNNDEDSREDNERRRNNKNSGNSNSPQNKNDKGRRKGGKSDFDSHLFKQNPIDGFLKFIQEIGDQVLPTKYFWKRLPSHICLDDMNVEKNGTAVCWTGRTMGKYDIPEVQDGLKNQEFNQEVSIDPKRRSTTISEQIYTLRTVTTKLKSAYEGRDVEWPDSEEPFDSSSGSGMYIDQDGFNPTEGSGFEPPSGPVTDDSTGNSLPTSTEEHDHNVPFTPLMPGIFDAGHTPVDPIVPPIDSSSTSGPIDSTTISTTYNVSNTTIHNSTSDGTTIRYDRRMSLNQAIATYLLPTVVVWMGGSFNEWFHTVVCNLHL